MRRAHLVVAMSLTVPALVALAPAGHAAPAGCTTESAVLTCFLGGGESHSFTVPANPGPLEVFVQGGHGGSFGPADGPFPGGEGAGVGATFAVRAGDVVTMRVGGAGADRTTVGGTAAGGANGGAPGGAHGAGGGGWTGVQIVRAGQVVGLAVAGGGGGAADGDYGYPAVGRGETSPLPIDASATEPGWRADPECPECPVGPDGAAAPAFTGETGGSGGSGIPRDGGGGGGGYFGGGGGLTDAEESGDPQDDGSTNGVARTGGGGGSTLVRGATQVTDGPWENAAPADPGFGALRLGPGAPAKPAATSAGSRVIALGLADVAGVRERPI
ncbi:hypothetical protein GCM10009547_10920 [Sporichthya brevicatena]|uniref:PE-PGRS family protein n=1 Tax=Sporichthya brevicatena TaxID=171442 RepID=A0ABN1GFW4_9ACTN